MIYDLVTCDMFKKSFMVSTCESSWGVIDSPDDQMFAGPFLNRSPHP